MNNLAAHVHKFFIFGGAILIATAILQILNRPRAQDRTLAARLLNATTIKAFFFVTFGILTILVGTGTIPIALGR